MEEYEPPTWSKRYEVSVESSDGMGPADAKILEFKDRRSVGEVKAIAANIYGYGRVINVKVLPDDL